MRVLLVIVSVLFVAQVHAADKKAVLNHYADLALAIYSDSLQTAKSLQAALARLVASPTPANLMQARAAWRAARVPYQQSEVYRFGNAIVDDWEGKVNAWPLDEGLIDYVAASYGADSEDNPLYTANVIANTKLEIAGRRVDLSTIDKALLSETLHEAGGVEANVATGYHAIEFLLWGQDLNGTGPGAGKRLATDFDVKQCSHGHCERRGQYLLAAGALLVDDLAWMVTQWHKDGAARRALLSNSEAGLASILTGMGSLSYGELAGERIKLGVLLHDPEEEHDCFSDNTHYSHYYDILGIENVYLGRYRRVNGELITGSSLAELLHQTDRKVDEQLRQRLQASLGAAQSIVDSAQKHGVAYDQLLAEGNAAGNLQIMQLVDALLAQTKAIDMAVHALGLSQIAFEGSDALDQPSAVFQ